MIVVVGATGTIGSELIRLLAERDVAVRAMSRRPPEDDPRNIEWVEGDLTDVDRLRDVFEGASRLYLATGNVADMVVLQKNAIRAAEQTGLQHVVKVSALGASDHSKSVIGMWHYVVERALRESKLSWTILRPHVFMQNVLDQAASIRETGSLYSPSADARIPMIDTRDIAAVAADVLTEEGHAGERYTLTGPEAVSYRDVARTLSDVLDRPIRYVAETEDDAWRRLHGEGQPPWLIGAQLSLAAYQRAGGGTDIITDAVDSITSKPPRTIEAFARDYAAALSVR